VDYFRGVSRNFSIVWTEKFRGVWDFFLKNPSKLKKIHKKRGGGFDPTNPLPEYAPGLLCPFMILTF